MGNSPRDPVLFSKFRFTETEEEGTPQKIAAVRFAAHVRHAPGDAKTQFPAGAWNTGLLVQLEPPTPNSPNVWACEYDVPSADGSDFNQIWVEYQEVGSTSWNLLGLFGLPENSGSSPAFALLNVAVTYVGGTWSVDLASQAIPSGS